MKKFLLILTALAISVILMVSVSANDVAEATTAVVETTTEIAEETTVPTTEATTEATETVTTEAVTTEAVTTEATTVATAETTIPVLDKDKLAEQFIGYIMSGDEGSEELLDKIIAMGEQYKQYKEDGYTLEERIAEMMTADNLVVLASAAFLVVCGSAFFVFEGKRKKERRTNAAYIARFDTKLNEECETNANLKKIVEDQSAHIAELQEQIKHLCENADANKLDLDKVTHANEAVAKMIFDVFLCSRTLDKSAKELLTHNYMEAIGDHRNEEQG